MTKFFVKWFKGKTKEISHCGSCKDDPAPNRCFCAKHLAYARVKFHEWSSHRRKTGLCISCDRDGVNGWLRCVVHVKYNRRMCTLWMRRKLKENPRYHTEKWEARKAKADAQGVCRTCLKNSRIPQSTRCYDCRLRATKGSAMRRKAART